MSIYIVVGVVDVDGRRSLGLSMNLLLLLEYVVASPVQPADPLLLEQQRNVEPRLMHVNETHEPLSTAS